MLYTWISILKSYKSVRNLKPLFLNMLSLDEMFSFLCYTARSYIVKECSFILDYTHEQALYSKFILGFKTIKMLSREKIKYRVSLLKLINFPVSDRYIHHIMLL